MIEKERTKLSPEEVGAFVAQWAEQHPIDVQRLSEILGVDESTAESLMRQAQGRLSRQKWVVGQTTGSKRSPMNWLLVAGALLIGAGLGAFLVSTFLTQKQTTEGASASLAPKVEVTTEMSPTNKPTIPGSGISPNPRGVPVAPKHISDSAGGGGAVSMSGSALHSFGRVDRPPSVKMSGGRASNVQGGQTTMTSLSGTSVLRLPKTLGNPTQDSEGPLMADDPADAKLPLEDATAKLASKMPDDLKVEMFTPTKRFIFKGKETKSVQGAMKLNQKDLAKPIQNTLAYVVEHGMLSSDITARPQRSPSLRIRISVGSAQAFATLPWIPAQKAMLLSLAKSNNSLFFMMLEGPLMSRVRTLSSHLFSLPSKN